MIWRVCAIGADCVTWPDHLCFNWMHPSSRLCVGHCPTGSDNGSKKWVIDIEDRAERVFTKKLRYAKELLEAAGLAHPSELNRHIL